MTFLAPVWLALLLPWAGVVAWLWRRTADERDTTAAFLWDRETPDLSQRRKAYRHPPAWVLCGLLGLLTAIIALANPARTGRAVRIGVVVDGSLWLAAKADRSSKTLRDELLDRIEAERAASHDIAIEFDVRFAGITDQPPDFASAYHARFTAAPTTQAVDAAIDDALRTSDTVVAVTGQPIERVDPRLAVLTPAAHVDNVGIVTAVAVDLPKPSLMVRVLNDSDRESAMLSVRSGEASTERKIALPRRGQSINVFFDLPSFTESIDVSLIGENDALPDDDGVTLLRTAEPVQLTLDGAVPPIATRFAAAYDQARGGPVGGKTTVAIRSTVDAKSTSPQLILASPETAVAGVWRAVDHPIFQDVDLARPQITQAARFPAGDWTPIAWLDASPIVGVHESAPRGVWIGFDLDPNQLRSVILMNNAIDWLANGGQTAWRGESPASIGRDWKPLNLRRPDVDASPGTYLDATGKTVAVNFPATTIATNLSHGDVRGLIQMAARANLISLRTPLVIAVGVLSVACAGFVRHARKS